MGVANEADDVFISYSRADTRHAAEIELGPPRKRGESIL